MCLQARQGRTNSKTYRSFRPYRVGYKCGYCAECLREKRNEWLLRSYFESIDTLVHGHRRPYVLFDTLTYDDEHINHISKFYPDILSEDYLEYLRTNYEGFRDMSNIDLMSQADFTCFSYEDVRKFTNLLWTTINRQPRLEDYDVKRNIKFFLVSEYGHDDIYKDDRGRERKGTFRPHYHVLFYVKDGNLRPGVLAHLIHRCWKRGDTDNHRNGVGHMMLKNVIGCGYQRNAKRDIIAVSNYVSKYITKQADFMEKIERRVDILTRYLIMKNCKLKYNVKETQEYVEVEEGQFRWMSFQHADFGDIDFSKWYEKRDEVMRFCSPFHRQSRGFGLSAIDDDEVYASIMSSFCIAIPDAKYGMKKYNVPLYYMRKLFYKTVTDADGMYHWMLNDLGRSEYPNIVKAKVYNSNKKYNEQFYNLSEDDRVFVLSLLDGRDLSEFVDYLTFYKGRIMDKSYMRIDEETGEIKILPSIDEVIEIDRNFNPLEEGDWSSAGDSVLHSYIRPYGCQDLINELRFGNPNLEWNDEDILVHDVVDFDYISFKDYEKSFVINQDTVYDFRNFDMLFNFFQYTHAEKDDDKQRTFDFRSDLKKKFNAMGIKTSKI